jgi:tetratricopeptide (TPR) repeat protein
LGQQSFGEAVLAFSKAAQHALDPLLPYQKVAEVFLLQQEWDKLEDIYIQVISLPSFESLTATERAETLGNLGEAQARLGKWDLASATLKTACECAPEDFQLAGKLGKCEYKVRDFAAAVTSFQRAISSAPLETPELPRWHYQLGKTYCNMEKWGDAHEELQRAIQLGSCNLKVLAYLGGVQKQLGHLIAAEKTFREILKEDPTYYWGIKGLMEILDPLGKGDTPECRALVTTLENLTPPN